MPLPCLILMVVEATIPRALLRSQASDKTQSPQEKDSFPQTMAQLGNISVQETLVK